jgi:predicted ribosomally synthesized peptide with nif11-like leader
MSEEQLGAFWNAVEADNALQKELQGVTDPDVIVGVAQKAGFAISADEIRSAAKDLTEEELEDVAGGLDWRLNPSGEYPAYP